MKRRQPEILSTTGRILVLSLILGAAVQRPASAQLPRVQQLVAMDGVQGDGHGVAVSLSGSTLAVGAHQRNNLTGAVYIYTLSGTTWTPQATLTASDGGPNSGFGMSISLQGNTLIVGAVGASKAYVFTRSGTVWSQRAILRGSDTLTGDGFGNSVAVSANGSTVVVGAPFQNGTGAAYVFAPSGTAWTQRAKLVSDNTQQNLFGHSVAVSGITIAVGAPYYNTHTGAAFLFVPNGTTWKSLSKLQASDGQISDQFGISMAMTDSTLVIGADGRDGGSTGGAYIFAQFGTAWLQLEILTADDSIGGARFGHSVAVNGSRIAVGSTGLKNGTGAVYLFDSLGYGNLKLVAKDGRQGDFLGWSVAISGSIMATGAPYRQTNPGAVYVTP